MDKSLLTRATDSTSAPTPGYLYNDIGKTLTSPQICIDTCNFLITRLSSKNNPHVKKKCCKVLSKLVQHPVNRGMLKRTLAQNPNSIGVIKECMVYRGTVDAVMGDQWNVEVREAAKECLDVVYSDSGVEEYHHPTNNAFGGIGGGGGGGMPPGGMAGLQQQQPQGYGGPVAAQGIGGGGYGGYGPPMGGNSGSSSGGYGAPGGMNGGGGASRMQGIGNPMFADPRLAQQQTATTTVGKLSQMATEVGGAVLDLIKDPLAKQAAAIGGGQHHHPNMGTYGGPNMRPDPYSPSQPPGRNNLALQTGGQWTMASNRGPNAIGGGSGGGMMTTTPPVHVAEATTQRHDDSEYYKARNAGGTAFNWASSSSGGAAAAAPAAPTVGGVGGSWANTPVAPPPPPPPVSSAPTTTTPQVSVAAQSRMDANHASPYTRGGGGGGGGVSFGNPDGGAISAAGGVGSYEKNLIAELCPPGGMKAEPPQDKLDDFARSVPTLNPDLVCPALLDALEDGNPWIMRAKALCVIETVLKVMDQQQGESNAYADFFHACSSEIEPLANHARQSVKAPARRVLGLLGIAPGAATPSSPTRMNNNGAASVASTNTAFVAEAPNLLDFDGPSDIPAPVAAPPPPPAAVTSVANVSGGDSMFGGMTMKSGGGGGGGNVMTVLPSTNSPAAPALVSTESTESSGDLLGSFSISAEAAPVAAAAPSSVSNDLFGNMKVKSNAAEPSVAAAAAPSTDASSVGLSSGGSAFGFLNATTPSSTPSHPAPKVMAPPSPAASYDPLLTLGSTATTNGGGAMNKNGMNHSNQMAQMNPAQMQQMQMAYQQNMMMMQQQMQQMQMGGGAGGQAYGRQGGNPMVMGANYMRQVPGVQGDNSSFSFLGAPKKKDSHEFDFVKDAMKRG